MRCFYSDTFVLPLPDGHRFPMTKYSRLRERLLADGIVADSDMVIPPPAAWDDIRLAHDDRYVNAVAHGTLSAAEQRRIGFPWTPAMVERSRRSVGATIAAARHVLVRHARVAANLAGGTHHAFADSGGGYCVFNDVAVTARVLQRDGLVVRTTIVDCDVHQGDGTAAIFEHDETVFTMSLHGATNFPFQKRRSDLDLVFDDHTADAAYMERLTEHLPRVLDTSAPELVFYLAGADPYEGDRLGKLSLTIEGLRCRDRYVFGQCRARSIPVVVVMAGGYCPDIDSIVTIHANTIKEAVRSADAVD